MRDHCCTDWGDLSPNHVIALRFCLIDNTETWTDAVHRCVHCLWMSSIRPGKRVRPTAPQRCTVELRRGEHGWTLGDVKAMANNAASRTALTHIHRWLEICAGDETA